MYNYSKACSLFATTRKHVNGTVNAGTKVSGALLCVDAIVTATTMIVLDRYFPHVNRGQTKHGFVKCGG